MNSRKLLLTVVWSLTLASFVAGYQSLAEDSGTPDGNGSGSCHQWDSPAILVPKTAHVCFAQIDPGQPFGALKILTAGSSVPAGSHMAVIVESKDVPQIELDAIRSLPNVELVQVTKLCKDSKLLNQLAMVMTIKYLWIADASDSSDQDLCELQKLTSLRKLAVAFGSKLTGEFLRFLPACSALDELYLARCDLLEAESFSISDCPTLAQVSIICCPKLKEGIFRPRANVASALKSVHCESCGITDSFWQLIDQYPELESITVKACPSIIGAGLGHLARLKKLSRVALTDMRSIEGSQLGKLSESASIRELVLDFTNLSDEAMGAWHWKELDFASFERCDSITDAGVAEFLSRTSVQRLKLAGCRELTGSFVSKMLLAEVRLLNLSSLPVKDEQLTALKRAVGLETLVLDGCDELEGDFLEYAGTMKSLQHLNCDGCTKLSVEHLRQLGQFTRLKTLLVSHVDAVDDSILESLCSLQHLESLYINSCRAVTNRGIRLLTGLPKLRSLYCRSLDLDDEALSMLATVSTLSELDVTRCVRITAAGCAAFAKKRPEVKLIGSK